MAEAIRLGRMTDTMEEGFVAELSIKVGDKVKAGDTIAEIETDKATLPLESYSNGVVLHIAAKKGDTLKINDLIAIVGKEGEDYSSLLQSASEPSAKSKESDQQEKAGNKEEVSDTIAIKEAKPETEKGKPEIVEPATANQQREIPSD